MTQFDGGDWVECLMGALGRVDEVEGEFRDEFAERCRLQKEAAREPPYGYGASDPAGDRRRLYLAVRYSKGGDADRRYEPLRSALRDAENVLGRHRAVAAVLKADARCEELVVRTLDGDHETSRLAMVAGLLCRAREAGEKGLEIASRELKSLLDRSLDGECSSGSDVLTTGYDVSVLYGLHLVAEVEIADNLKAVPVEQTEGLVDQEMVRGVAPPWVGEHGREGVSVILEAVPWKPVLLSPGDRTERLRKPTGSFIGEGCDFVELLSVLHGVPMVSLVSFPDCMHRTALLLLGIPREPGSMGVTPWERVYANLREPRALDRGALEQARRIMSEPARSRHRAYGPVISRLYEAVARTGQYAEDDRILDVAIALEQLYELDQGEISFKLRIRAACFLESETQARLCVFRKVGKLYDARSRIVHRRTKKSSLESKEEAFENGFEVARDSVVKLLLEGPPRDWNELVMAGMGNPVPQDLDCTHHAPGAQ